MANSKIKSLYSEVGNSLEDALQEVESIKLRGKEENIELKAIKKTLSEMNESFKQEIETLEKSSEWDKFCISFFGETNAGKSTILDTLRIIYNEQSRKAEIQENTKTLINEYKNDITKLEELTNSLKELNEFIETRKNSKNFLKYIIIAAVFFTLGFLIKAFII